MNPRVLVIVVSHNGMRWLPRCLSSVMPGAKTPDSAPEVDVYVWDNASTDGSADFVAENYPQAVLVRSRENLGFSIPNNKGFEYAIREGYDYAYLLNQDAWIEPGALDWLVASARAHPEYGVLSPLQMMDGYRELDRQFAKWYSGSGAGACSQTQGHPRPCPFRANVPWGTIGGQNSPGREGPADEVGGRGRSEAKAVWEYAPAPEPVPFIMAAHWLVQISVVKKIGPFEEELFPLYGQDDEWCRRLHFFGLKVGVVPQARAVHDRQQRQEPLERVVYRNYYTGSLVRLCDVSRPLFEKFLFVIAFTFVKTVKYRSALPFKYFRKICRDLPKVRKLRSLVRARAHNAK
ncbi:MAG: glycosyltransferase family 2 protein [Bacteroidales bacterium]|nr:glycosyltransferase family 2 protein [Bacteroidales bacterium]